MEKSYKPVLKVFLLLLCILILVIVIVKFTGALREKSSMHPLNFQDNEKIILDKPVNSVEDGYSYALNRAHEWRQDAVLTGIQIISESKEEIENENGRIMYIFEFPYVDESKPSGLMFVSINTNSNCIEYVSAIHDGEAGTRDVSELKTDGLTESIKKVYSIAIDTIGKDNIFQYEKPYVRVFVDQGTASFDVSPSKEEAGKTKTSVKIDMKTFEIVNNGINKRLIK